MAPGQPLWGRIKRFASSIGGNYREISLTLLLPSDTSEASGIWDSTDMSIFVYVNPVVCSCTATLERWRSV